MTYNYDELADRASDQLHDQIDACAAGLIGLAHRRLAVDRDDELALAVLDLCGVTDEDLDEIERRAKRGD